MRWWTMPDGRALVEGPAEERILDGEPIADAHVYYLCGPDDAVLRAFSGYDGSVDEYLYIKGHVVRDGRLHGIYRQIHDSGRREGSEDVEVSGLVPADPAETERFVRLKAAIDAYVRKHAR